MLNNDPEEDNIMDEKKLDTLEETVDIDNAIAETATEEVEKTAEQLAEEEWQAEHDRKKKIQAVWDKITTGFLIFLMASPILILGWIFYWFLTV